MWGEMISGVNMRVVVCVTSCSCYFFFNDTATTEIYTLSLHDALPILCCGSKTFGWEEELCVGKVRCVVLQVRK